VVYVLHGKKKKKKKRGGGEAELIKIIDGIYLLIGIIK
jgi:hypothetical protein